MQRAFFLALSAAIASAAAIPCAQEQPDPRTLIPSPALNAIAQHVSGAQPRNHVLELRPCERNPPAEEYQGTYRESAEDAFLRALCELRGYTWTNEA